VLADPGEIHRIIINLCTNASLAMKENGGILEIALEEVTLDAAFVGIHLDVKSGRYLRLTVRDTGCGMTEAVKARIFEPFFTTRKEGQGTGMGLSVVHGIVKSRGGTISVVSEPGKGTVFQIFLPLAELTEGGETAGVDTPLPGGERILFVDDEPMVCDINRRALEKLGYRVVTLVSSTEALERFRAAPAEFDLVITDMTMPGLTGDALAQNLRGIRPDIPIIFCTGFSERMNAEIARAMGNADFIPKPIAAARLTRIIRQIMANG